MKEIYLLIFINLAFTAFLNKQSQALSQNPSLNFWDYIKGGDDWQHVNTWQCNLNQQSPINIQLEDILPLPNCKLFTNIETIDQTKLEIINTGHTLKIEGPKELLKLKVNGADGQVLNYECGTMNMHAPSEHTIENNHFDLEMHIVCKEITKDNQFGVLTLLFEGERNVQNQFFEPFGAAAASLKYKGDKAQIIMDFKETFQKEISKLGELHYYNYKGSFTTPPCTEQIEWFILSKPMKIPIQLLENFNKLWEQNQEFAAGSGNNRNVQPLNNRFVFKGSLTNDPKEIDNQNIERAKKVYRIKGEIMQLQSQIKYLSSEVIIAVQKTKEAQEYEYQVKKKLQTAEQQLYKLQKNQEENNKELAKESKAVTHDGDEIDISNIDELQLYFA